MNFHRVLRDIAEGFAQSGIDFALIGGFALAALGVPRATGDLDFLVSADRADDVSRLMRGLGYRELHRSADAANYAGLAAELGRVDFLFAHRPHSVAMLARAQSRTITRWLAVKIVDVEDLIGLKVQSSTNNPRRMGLDMADIERLLAAHPDLDLARVREYFRIFDREAELDALLQRSGS